MSTLPGVDGDDRTARILDRLRAEGGRVTTARRALILAMVAADGHMTAEDLAVSVQAAHPDVHRSTIYRTLDALERLGVVDHVHLGHGRAVYHLADEPHHHLVCEECGTEFRVSKLGELQIPRHCGEKMAVVRRAAEA